MKLRITRSSAEVPTSPMADIAFLLIIFFMLTAVFNTTQGLEFAFPKDDPTRTDVEPQEAIHIKIIGIDQFIVDKTPMTPEQMAGYIQGKMAQVPDKPVIIQTLPVVPYYVMIDVFDLLKQLEVQNISIPTQSEVARWQAFGVLE